MLLSEWLKLRTYAPFWVLIALYAVSLSGVVGVAVYLDYEGMQQANLAGLLGGHPVFQYPAAWQMVSYLASYLQFIPALLVILTTTNEFSFRTHRQNILDGWSRNQFLGAKLAVVAALTVFPTVTVAALTLIAAGINKQIPSPNGLEQLAAFALQTLVYQLFALLTAMVLRRAALAMAAFLLYSVILERIVFGLLCWKAPAISYYLPLTAANTVLLPPYTREIPGVTLPDTYLLAAAAAGYGLLFVGVLWLKLRREDL